MSRFLFVLIISFNKVGLSNSCLPLDFSTKNLISRHPPVPTLKPIANFPHTSFPRPFVPTTCIFSVNSPLQGRLPQPLEDNLQK